jgi:hypothetical protein
MLLSCLLLWAAVAGCAGTGNTGPEIRYSTQLRSGDLVYLSAEPLVNDTAAAGGSASERITLHVRRPSGRLIETEIGWGLDCSRLQVRTDERQERIWVVNSETNQIIASHLLLSAEGVADADSSPPLPSRGGYVLVNTLTGSGSASGPGTGVRGIYTGRGRTSGCSP